MTQKIDRRAALLFAGGLAATATAPAIAKTPKGAPGTFQSMPMPYASMFPRTKYYEIDSARAGARYAVWVSVPEVYDKDPSRSFPAVFAPDGNHFVAFSTTLCELGQWDLIDKYQSTIQVCIGYTGKDADVSLAVRARDLLPPKEPLPPGMVDAMRKGGASDLLDAAGVELYIRNLENPAADHFLAFISDELYPFIAKNYRIQSDNLGLFGHSYGGLFTTYAALQPKTIFKNFGASSPGILPGLSTVFKLHADAAAAGGLSERNLHLTVGTRELTVPGLYQYMVGEGSVEFIRTAGTTPVKGLNFSSKLMEDESHMTLAHPAAFEFMRQYYRARG